MKAWLGDHALRRVLQSLIAATARVLAPRRPFTTFSWPDAFGLGEDGLECLGCDSLDRLQVATEINEMFHVHEVGLEGGLLQAATFGQVVEIVQQAWSEGVSQVSVRTSVSTGLPKFCVHSWENLALEIDCIAERFSGRSRVVGYTPVHHLYGLLFTAMLPDRLSISTRDLQAVGAGFSRLELQSSDLVVSFPDGWKWIEANTHAVPPDVQGVTSTAPCPRELIDALTSARFDGFTEVYGASETAGIGMRVWPDPNYTLMPQWQRSGDTEQSRLRHRSGYEVEAMDALTFVDSTRFLVSRRTDGAVQVGGANVFPALIARRLQSFPGVARAAVRKMRPSEGSRLKCFIVPVLTGSTEHLERKLSRWFETWEVAAERPKRISFGQHLPKGDMGKVCDW